MVCDVRKRFLHSPSGPRLPSSSLSFMTDTTLLAALLGALLVALLAYTLGRLFLAVFAISLSRLEMVLFSILTGTAALSSIVFILCSVHEARKGAFVAIAVIAGLLVIALPKSTISARRSRFITRDQLALGTVVYLYFAVIYLVNAAAPEFSPDGATYHLGTVARWWKLSGFDTYAGSIYSDWSQGLELVFLVAFTVGKHQSAAIVHCLFGLLLPVLFFSYGVRIGKVWIMTAAGLVLFASPVVGRTASSAYNDLAVACLLFGVFYLIELWRIEHRSRLLVACGWLAGFAFAVKYTAIVALLYALVAVLWESRKSEKVQLIRRAGILIVFATATGGPWLVKNAILLGNPVSPFFNRIFTNPYVHLSFESEYARAMSLYPEISSRWNLPWIWAVDGKAVAGIFGPWILFLPLALLFVRDTLVQRFVLAAGLMGWPIFLNCGTRFLLPALIFAAPALMIALSRLGIRPAAFLALSAVLCVPQIVPLYSGQNVWRFEDFPWRAALHFEPAQKFLSRKMAAFPMANEIERLVPLNAKTFSTIQIPLAYTTRRIWHNWQSAEAEVAHATLLYALNPSGQDGLETQFSFSQRSISGVRVRSVTGSESPWQVSELFVSQNGLPILRRPGWSNLSSPNRWEVGLASDGNLATVWSTWVPLRKGDFVGLRFAHPIDVDSLSVISGGMPNGEQWQIEILSANDNWELVQSTLRVTGREKNANARATAVQGLKSLGFDYLIVDREDELGRDILDRTSEWKLEMIGGANGAALFHIP